jgi:endonuclease/exonuclease/phosphatase family metal-dependent hydrolase
MLLASISPAQTFKAMTYNIKYDNVRDTVNNWHDRKDKMAQLVDHYHPAFLGIQEGLAHQVKFLDEHLTDYSFVGVGRDDGQTKGEYSALFYDKTRFKVIESATFWLSDTPDRVSVGWDAAMERVCTYGLFENLSDHEKIWVFNTHFDHLGQVARKESAALIVNKIESLNGQDLPVILMGDFNAIPEDEPIKLIKRSMTDALDISAMPLYGPAGTFNGFTDIVMTRRIDYIFIKNLAVLSYAHLDDKLANNKHISDHLPVLVDVQIKE